MKKRTQIRLYAVLGVLAVVVFIMLGRVATQQSQERTFVILSTNDMHAQIDKFPALASAIAACRDTIDVVLVDAGDRTTGNAFVDLVEHLKPMYDLMNHVGYDVATYGNHEFDKGLENLAAVDRQASFPILGANITSHTNVFPQPAGYHVEEVAGVKIAFVGVVGNDDNGHPSGKDECYEGVEFASPQISAQTYAKLREECDMLVLVSHCGLERDTEFANSELAKGYDMVISAHSHDVANETINNILVTQTGSRLKNIGATTVKIDKDGNISLSHKVVPLSTYKADETVAKMVEEYYNNPELNVPIGQAASDFNVTALQNLFTEAIRSRTNCNIGIYHQGGVRIEKIAEGDIPLSALLNAEPFGSYVSTAKMSVAQIKEMIITKFNDKENITEAHEVDLIATTPYTIVTNAEGDAVDVIFPRLDAKRIYKVATGDYIFKRYKGLNYSEGEVTNLLITDVLHDYISKRSPLKPDSEVYQNIVTQESLSATE